MYRKNKSMVLMACISFGFILSGCVTQKEYDDLNKRLTAVEERLNDTSENTIKSENDIPYSDPSQNESENIAHEDYSYVIDDMSVDEIVEECFYYFNNLPSEGQSFDEYETTFKVIPKITRGNVSYVFNDLEHNKAPEKDIVESVFVGMDSNLDGSIHIKYDYIEVTVNLWIDNYDEAVAIYDALKQKLEPFYSDIREHKDSSYWDCSGYYDEYDNDGRHRGAIGVGIVAIHKIDDCFNIKATKYTTVSFNTKSEGEEY